MNQRLLPLLGLVLLLFASCSTPTTTTHPTGSSAAPRAAPTASRISPPGMDPALSTAVLFTRYAPQRDRHDLQPVNPESGQVLTTYPSIELSRNVAHAFSPDGERLAIVGYNFAGCGQSEICDGIFYSVDLRTWRTVTTTLQIDDYVHTIAFDPNGRQVAFVYGRLDQQTLVVMDMQPPRLVVRRSLPLQPNQLAWTLDGAALLMYGPALQPMGFITEQPRQKVLKARTSDLQTTWEAEIAGLLDGIWCVEHCTARDDSVVQTEWEAAKVFTEDKQHLLIVHPDSDTLTTVDWVAQQVQTGPIQVTQGWVDRALALTASNVAAKNIARGGGKAALLTSDGTHLYVTQYTQRPADSPDKLPIREYGPLQVVDWRAQTMTLRPELRFAAMQPAEDRATVYWFLPPPEHGPQTIQVRDSHDLALKQAITLDSPDSLWATRRLNGQPILVVTTHTDAATTFKVLDPANLEPRHVWKLQGYAEWFVPLAS